MNNDYEAGFKAGYDDGYGKGYWAGCCQRDECGRCLNVVKPPGVLIPGYGVIDLLKAGLSTGRFKVARLLTPNEVEAKISAALSCGNGLSIVTIDEDAMVNLVTGAGYPLPPAKFKGREVPVAIRRTEGMAPSIPARLLADAIREADVVGVPTLSAPNYLPVLYRSLRALGSDLTDGKIARSTIAYQALGTGVLARLLLSSIRPRIAVVSPSPGAFVKVLREEGANIVACVQPSNAEDVGQFTESTIKQLREAAPAVVLLSVPLAGIVLAPRCAAEFNAIAWDIGRLSPALLAGLERMKAGDTR